MEVKNEINKRYLIIYWSIIAFFVVIIVRVVTIWLFQREFFSNFQISQQFKPLQAIRGDIIDCRGRTLATTLTRYNISFDPNTERLKKTKVFDENIDKLCDSLAKILKDKSANEYKKMIVQARRNNSRDIPIAQDLDYFTFKRIKNLPIFNLGKIKGGFKYQKNYEPILLHNDLGRRTIGFENTQQKFFGIQKQMNDILKGVNGQALMLNLGNNTFIEQEIIKNAENGDNVVTTIDINLQDLANNILLKQLKQLDAKSGVVIIMEVETGKIRALVNLGKKDSTYAEIQNFAITSLYEPGSVIKLASLIAALERNPKISLEQKIETGNGLWQVANNFTIKDYNYKDGGFGTLTIREVFEKSSNIGIAKIVQNIFGSNPEEFVQRVSNLHLDKPLDLRLDDEIKPQITKPGTKRWSKVSYLQISYGYEISVTPMHLITLYNAIANNGKMVKPRFVERTEKDGKIKSVFETEVISEKICSQRTIDIVKELLLGVVERGTGKDEVKSELIKIAGKSGTANRFNKLGYETDNVEATFIGYFPAEKPKYTCLVWISQPKIKKSGSQAAGPIVKQIAEAIYAFDPDMHNRNFIINKYKPIDGIFPRIPNGFSPFITKTLQQNGIKYIDTKAKWTDAQIDNNQIVLTPIQLKNKTMPNVLGMNARDAVFLLESMGLIVKISGFGKVSNQSIEPGQKLVKNTTVYLTLKN